VRRAKTTPATFTKVPPGLYRVIAVVPGYGFHEVYRLVPAQGKANGLYPHESWFERDDGAIEWPLITIPSDQQATTGMIALPGGRFQMGTDGPDNKWRRSLVGPAHTRVLPPFLLDETEVTVGEYRKLATLPDAVSKRFAEPPADFDTYAVTDVTFHQALAYAESVGKRLPTEEEYEFAATNAGNDPYPWGKDPTKLPPAWQSAPVRGWPIDRTPAGVRDLYSNVLEWTDSLLTPYDPEVHPSKTRKQLHGDEMFFNYQTSRVVRGGPASAINPAAAHPEESAWGARNRFSRPANSSSRVIGFRCARSSAPPAFDESRGR
jgi:formylglycine-generating enzyme required for sulfatase activity